MLDTIVPLRAQEENFQKSAEKSDETQTCQTQLGFLIGRFQIFHRAHLGWIRQALKTCDRLLMIIGSAYRARSVKNPFTYDERVKMIQHVLRHEEPDFLDRIVFAPVEDEMYDEVEWVRQVQAAVTRHLEPHDTPLLVGHQKDGSTYYLELFPGCPRLEFPGVPHLNATCIRDDWMSGKLPVSETREWIHDAMYQWLLNVSKTSLYRTLRDEWQFLKRYRQSWSASPYPPIFSTVDALVMCQQHVLLIRRGQGVGKGLYALPGGFLEPHEWVIKGAVRELMEETQIACSASHVLSHRQSVKVFDHPERSQLGRVITHVSVFLLPDAELPQVKGADDAQAALWMPIKSLCDLRDQFHDDHYYILKTVLNISSN